MTTPSFLTEREGMTAVEYVRWLCKQKGIPISKMETDLGYGNGYFNPKKLKRLTIEKAIDIADYLECDVFELLEEEDQKKLLDMNMSGDAPAKERRDPYYYNEETRRIAQEIFECKELHALFDAARGSKPEDLRMAKDLLRRLKETNPDG